MGGKGSGRVGVKCSHGLTISYCKSCQASRKRRPLSNAQNIISKKQMVRNYKIALKHCVICMVKINEANFMMFALDHREPTQKLFNLSQARTWSREQVIDECRKCELMCHNCHHLKTHKSGDHKVRRDAITVANEQLPLLELMYGTD